jgi:hypothetical protein
MLTFKGSEYVLVSQARAGFHLETLCPLHENRGCGDLLNAPEAAPSSDFPV